MTLAQLIKERGGLIGFDLVGIAPAERSSTADAYQQWLDEGMAGEMGYMTRNVERRKDILATMPDAKSVIVCALSYYTGDPPSDLMSDPSRGMISRYAWGDDYHSVMETKLRELLSWIQTQNPQTVTGKVYVDTGPILERDIGARAGIGWFGKHTSLLSKKLGNWFFLGEILINVELDYDTPASAHCGTCRRCIDACPTGAIVAPYRLDARLCISYLTIELKGPIPREMRPLIGNRIFGCDDCLAVCPWNKHARLASEIGLRPRDGLLMPDLRMLMQLTEEEFRVRFRNSPIKRIKRRGLLRNVAVTLGNMKDSGSVPVLTTALNDYEPLIRSHAAWALGQIGTAEARAALKAGMEQERDPSVKCEIRDALADSEKMTFL